MTEMIVNKTTLRKKSSQMSVSRPLLAAFDFDHTICDDNSDIVARKLYPGDVLPDSVKRLYTGDTWTVYMGKIFELLNENSINVETIETSINRIPPVPGIDTLLTELHSRDCEIIIISDSNSVFIEWWLNHKGLSHTVKQVFTNPATVEKESGVLKIEMYHLQDYCKLSSKNLCKGQILEDYISKRSSEGVNFEKVAYVGDGKNDYCPILRLSEKDIAFPRLGYTLVNVLNQTKTDTNYETKQLKASVVPWESGEEILDDLKKRITSL